MSDDEISSPALKTPRYSKQIRKQLDAMLGKRAVMSTFTFGALVVVSEWNDRFWASLIIVALWQVASAIGASATAGMTQRRLPNTLFTVVSAAAMIALGTVTQWSTIGFLIVPCTIATFEVFGDGDTRPYVLAMLAAVAVAMAASHVQALQVLMVMIAGWRMHWISEGRGLTLRAAVGELEETNAALESEMNVRSTIETELRQAQKLEAVGRLAAGVAHEINTPVQYVRDSLSFLTSGSTDLLALLDTYRKATPRTPELDEADEAADLEFLRENVPDAFARCGDGLQRITTIVRSMRDFAHPERKEMHAADINRGVESTLIIAKSEYKLVADVKTELGDVPPVTCHAGEVNQVVLNLIVNAAHAIADRVGTTGKRGLITLRTRLDGDGVVISVTDTGTGIPPDVQQRLFEPFFTTKGVGRGTGQGLAISRSVAKKHGGTLRFETVPGVGTTFFLRLPVTAQMQKKAA